MPRPPATPRPRASAWASRSSIGRRPGRDTAHWILRNQTSVSASLTSILFKVAYALTYVNEPVPGFGKTDTVTSAAVVAKF